MCIERCAAGLALAAALAAAAMPLAANEAPAGPSEERQVELVRLVRHDCGSCHGLTLRGGLGPALLPETLAARPRESLVATIMGGRPGTPMPPWRDFVSEAEAQWIVARLVERFPE